MINPQFVIYINVTSRHVKKEKKKKKNTYCKVGVMPLPSAEASLAGVGASSGCGVDGSANGVDVLWCNGVGMLGVWILAGVADGVAILNPDIIVIVDLIGWNKIRKKVVEKKKLKFSTEFWGKLFCGLFILFKLWLRFREFK